MTERVDALIAGAGPAGSTAALLLARAGWSVLLVDRAAPGRGKTCGHCLGARAWPLLDRLGLEALVHGLAHGPVRRLAVRSGATSLMSVALPESERHGPGVVVARGPLDRALQEAAIDAGVTMRHRATVRSAVRDGDRYRAELRSEGRSTEVEAALLVGADGVGSTVARTLGWGDGTAAGRRFGISFPRVVEDLAEPPEETIVMTIAREGYLGAVRQGNGVHAAALLRDGVSLAAGLARLDPARTAAPSGPRAHDVLACGPLPWRPRRRAARGAALVGDAAGYVEPFTGEGMTWAFESAAALADAAIRATRRVGRPCFDDEAATRYAHAWREQVGRGHRRCGRLAAALDRPWVIRTAAAACRACPPVSARLARRVARSVVAA